MWGEGGTPVLLLFLVQERVRTHTHTRAHRTEINTPELIDTCKLSHIRTAFYLPSKETVMQVQISSRHKRRSATHTLGVCYGTVIHTPREPSKRLESCGIV